ncbi:hypothetical protein Clacol_002665 [Clathrus columnatus]|uniref:Uncharacterized protein n=1 Tax=Clathrus columnatus TaxID=1419009 RepID=A0AAV5A1E0_9AGAM|nr:hypothetical protein Clacol_002665 [Clathrus columnatus]
MIKHASAWNGHVGSKGHRTIVAKLKEEEALLAVKRKKEEVEEEQTQTEEEDELPTKIRKLDDVNEEQTRRESQIGLGGEGFPSDFFSDPTRTLPAQDDDEESVRDDDGDKSKESSKQDRDRQTLDSGQAAHPPSIIDREWAEFQASVLDTDDKETGILEVFDRATIFAEPELVDEIPEGIPASVITPKEAVPSLKESQKSEQPPDEAHELRRRQEDERELIMDRLIEEERLQEEADERVSVLKARLELIKQRRVLSKKSKQS